MRIRPTNNASQALQFLKVYNQKKLKVGFFVDRLVRFFMPGGNKHKGYSEEPARILVIQSHLIGDVMGAIPMLRALKKKYPKAEISLFANNFATQLLGEAWFVDKIYTAPFPWGIRRKGISNYVSLFFAILRLRKLRFDLAIDAQIDFRNALLMFLIGARRRLGYDIVGGGSFLTDVPIFPPEIVNLIEGRLSVISYLGIDTSDKGYEPVLLAVAVKWADTFVVKNGLDGDDIVAVHPGASVWEKLWPSERFSRVIEEVESRGLSPILIEGPGDEKIVKEINGSLKCAVPVVRSALSNVMAIIAKCRLTVCLDSAASHLSSAVNTPAVVLYGPQWPETCKPFDDNVVAVWVEKLDCRPCSYAERSKGVNKCMDDIDTETVLKAIDDLLARTTRQKDCLYTEGKDGAQARSGTDMVQAVKEWKFEK